MKNFFFKNYILKKAKKCFVLKATETQITES